MVRLLIRLKFAACFKLCEAYILSSSTVYVWCGVVMVMMMLVIMVRLKFAARFKLRVN